MKAETVQKRHWLLGGRPLVLASVSCLLSVRALWVGWNSDDFFIRRRLTELPWGDAIMNLFVLPGGKGGEAWRYIDVNGLPWGTDLDLRVAFWRPLTALTHWLDYFLSPAQAFVAHVQSLFWLGVLVALATLCYRRLLGPTFAAGLAAFLYAVDDARGGPVAWIASRNTILVAVFGLAALLQHDRWRREGARGGVVLGPLCFALGLLAGEGAVGTLAYLAAYAFFLDAGTRGERLRSLLPYGVVLFAWRALYQSLGFGTAGSSFYVDPVHEPMRFLTVLVQHPPVLLLAQWVRIPAEVWAFGSVAGRLGYLAAAVGVMAVLVAVLAPLVWHQRTARFFAVGMLLALLPISATVPQDRLLVFVGVGAYGLLGLFVDGLLARAAWVPRARWWRGSAAVVAVALLLVHGLYAPLQLQTSVWAFTGAAPGTRELVLSIPPDPALETQQVVLVQGGMLVGFYYSDIRMLEGWPVPAHWRVLAPETSAVWLTRRDQRTLVVRPTEGYLQRWTSSDMGVNAMRRLDICTRPLEKPVALGERVELSGITVEVTALTGDGRPAEATYRFAVPLEDPSLRWLTRRGDRYVSFRLPKVGQWVFIEAVSS